MRNLFGFGKSSDDDKVGPPADIKWARNSNDRFHNLMFLDSSEESLEGVAGVYAIWHGGAESKWLYVGSTQNLAKTLEAKIDDSDIEPYYDRVGVYVSWSLVKPEFHGGIVRYLTDIMKPEIENPEAKNTSKDKPIAVLLPGKEQAAA